MHLTMHTHSNSSGLTHNPHTAYSIHIYALCHTHSITAIDTFTANALLKTMKESQNQRHLPPW